jgi:hypothetical protein
LKLPPDNRLRTPPVTPWAIPAFIGCINPAVNAPNIPSYGWNLIGIQKYIVGSMEIFVNS